MNSLFDIHVSKDRLTAEISLKNDIVEDAEITVDQLKEMLKERKVVFGIKQDVLEKICKDKYEVDYPIIVAEGIKPEKGRDGYLINKTEVEENQKTDEDDGKVFNLRNVMKIKSVKNGQLLAQIVESTMGIPGRDVYGNTIQAKNGRPLKLRAGKNVLYHLDSVFATIDGQISITPNTVNVLPVFEVNGDLDLKTGNIDFIGNVVIRGNVPTGYIIKAGGDIKVTGLVEGATLIAGGSVSISGGVAGAYKGSIEAGVDILANYLNQATCKAGRDISVESYILHSTISSGGKVVSRKGHIIGGETSALESIEANDFGNQHYMQTILYVGSSPKNLEREAEVYKELKQTREALKKLGYLFERIKKRERTQGYITEQDKLLLKKQQVTVATQKQYFEELEQELLRLKGEGHMDERVFLKAKGIIYPNAQIHFGKYSKPVQSKIQAVKIYLEYGEIVSSPL
ncbi:DUF342 domain-containing protein [Bacillus massiliigorillae]|uniref:DUF342 domain-containing protein n=1 Tax=Bacillus massiliigorillae TaxID=1243664 RepID=UPI00039E2E0D|nr:FapA family protein [Bacillus massiliigorillae]